MAYLLFPGRHIINTSFQEDYLRNILNLQVKNLDLFGSTGIDGDEKITGIIFAVTSSNQAHSRYNPIPFFERAISLDRFAQEFRKASGVEYRIIGIPHFDPNNKFAEYTIKEIFENTEGDIRLTPQNTIVLCSTPVLIEQYQKLGFAILSAEYDIVSKKFNADTPIELLKDIVKVGDRWFDDKNIKKKISKSSFETWHDFPSIPRTIFRLWNDPLLTDTGSLTIDRNYSSYAYGMNNDALMELKYQNIKHTIRPGKIVDEGCADAALLVRLAHDFPDSDLIGIELTTEFTARCMERLRAGEFGGTYVHFHQRNLLEKVFQDNTIDTTICNSTTHELWSYADQEKSLIGYLKKKFDQTVQGGRLIIRDVVGPEDKDEEVYMKLDDTDGSNDNPLKLCSDSESLATHLAGLSTAARFYRFAEEYLSDIRSKGQRTAESKISFKEETVAGEKYFVLKHKDAVEFITKKDYIDNWSSELNEEFAFWSFNEWKNVLSNIGFLVLENPNNTQTASRVYTNEWIVDNRWKGKAALFKKSEESRSANTANVDVNNQSLVPIDFPATNMVLVAEKPNRV